ncbi:MAG: V-type ATP synthase subunit I [Anaerolineae bacterium]
MFVPAEMSEVDIFVFENDVDTVAQTVAGLGIMHLLDVNSLGKWAEGVGTEWAGRISAYATQERRIKELLTQLDISEVTHPCEGRLNPSEDLVMVEEQLRGIEADTQQLRTQVAERRNELEHWELVAKSMEILAPLSVSISDLRQLQHLHLVAGTIPSENLARLEASLFRIPYSIIPVYHYKRRVLVFAFCAEEHAAILDRALESAFLDPLALPEEFGGTPQEALVQVMQRSRETQDKLDELEQDRQEMGRKLGTTLLTMLTLVRRDRAIAEAMSHFGHRGRVYLIAGWVPKDQVQSLRSAVEYAAEGRVTFEENSPFMPGEKRKVPTLLRNGRLLKPIEGLVTTYGTPGYQELDPTPLLAITFVIMFGVMFGDLGHGSVLAILGLLLAFKAIPALAGQAKIGSVLIACGLSSALFGVLYGSVFGIEDLIPSLWLRPMHDIFQLLGTSIAFGVLVLNIGFAFRLATAHREGRFRDAVFDKNGIVGLWLYWSLAGILIFVLLGRPVPGVLYISVLLSMLALFLAEPLTRLIYGERPLIHGSVAELGVQAFFELFEALISYVSNTLSYVRLGAFAVAHVGLSTVVFLLADMLGGGPGGAVIRLLIIVFGTLLIIGFEGLIVGIQTLRLEYYELFGKFFKGEGIPFKPLTLPAMECELNPLPLERSSS